MTRSKSFCPHCNEESNAFTGLNTEGRPGEGSIIICSECAGLQIVDTDLMTLRKLTDEELIGLKSTLEWPMVQATVTFIKFISLPTKNTGWDN